MNFHDPRPSARQKLWYGVGSMTWAVGLLAQTVAPGGGLHELSFEELGSITVTIVSKREEKYFNAAAAVHVITGEDIRRSGALLLPEVLRLAPGVEVGAINSRSYAVAMRGFNGTTSNKLLPLIDGRSLYSQRFASTIWDIRDLPLEDVHQIEVIGGPAGATWGANAVNGVINIITKPARDTQGDLWVATAGNYEQAQLYARHGFAAGKEGWARVYLKAFQRDDSAPVNVADNNDAWSQVRVGFRYDREQTNGSSTMITGDLFSSDADQLLSGQPARAHSSGGHLLGKYQRPFADGAQLRLQGYLDVIRRDSGGNLTEADVLDLDTLVTTSTDAPVAFSAGLNYRLSRLSDAVMGTPGVTANFIPQERRFQQVGIILEAAHRPLASRVHFTVGTKLEYNDFTDWEVMPSIRSAWLPNHHHTFWAAYSRAARIPSRFESDQLLVVNIPGFQSRTLPSPRLESEILSATELGWRWRSTQSLYWDINLFRHDYSQLVTTRILPSTDPASNDNDLDNRGSGTSQGAEVQLTWRPMSKWQLQAAYTYLDLEVGTESGISDPALALAPLLSPRYQFSLRSSWNISTSWEVDAWFRSVARLNQPGRVIPSYETLDLRVAKRFGSNWELSAVGQNLLESSHREFRFSAVQAAVPRGWYLRIEYRR